MSKAQREVRRWLANERAYAAVPTPDGTPDRVAELERAEEERRAARTVRHRDGDPHNNAVGNLEVVPATDE